MVSSTRSANRRSSWRERPRPPRHTRYCSVSLRSNGRVTEPALGVGLVLVHRNLLEDHRALRVDFPERRSEDDVGQDIERVGDVLVYNARVDGCRLLARARVDLAAHRIEDLIDLQRLVLRGSLE